MSDDLFDEIEAFLIDGGEREELANEKSFTFDEMRAKYGDEWADDFLRQFADHLRGDSQ